MPIPSRSLKSSQRHIVGRNMQRKVRYVNYMARSSKLKDLPETHGLVGFRRAGRTSHSAAPQEDRFRVSRLLRN